MTLESLPVIIFYHQSLPDIFIQTTILMDKAFEYGGLVAINTADMENYLLFLSQTHCIQPIGTAKMPGEQKQVVA